MNVDRRYVERGVIVLLVALVVAGLFVVTDPLNTHEDTPDAPPPFVLGARSTAKARATADVYAKALDAGGFTVDRRYDYDDTAALERALAAGDIDGYPDGTPPNMTLVVRGSVSSDALRRAVLDVKP